jgi:hypothetical protein
LSNDPVWVGTADPAPSRTELEDAVRLRVSGVVTAPEVGLFPGGRKRPEVPDAMGLVNVPAWFWAEDPGPGIVADETVTTTVGSYTLAATVKFRHTVYDSGDDDIVDCYSIGWDPRGQIHQPTVPSNGCYHTYYHKGDYHVTATTYFDVEWTGAGQHGTITGLSVKREADYHIGEIRVVIVNNP